MQHQVYVSHPAIGRTNRPARRMIAANRQQQPYVLVERGTTGRRGRVERGIPRTAYPLLPRPVQISRSGLVGQSDCCAGAKHGRTQAGGTISTQQYRVGP